MEEFQMENTSALTTFSPWNFTSEDDQLLTEDFSYINGTVFPGNYSNGIGNGNGFGGGFPLYETSHIPYPGTIVHPEPLQMAVKIFFYAVVMVVALVGNVLVVYIVASDKQMRTKTNCFIVNLAVSDILVTVSCPWVHLVDDLTEGWVLGAFFCKFNSFAQVVSLVSSILTLTLISCDRFFGIVFAMKAHMTNRRSTVFIQIIWVCAIGISSPLLIYRQQFIRPWLNHTEIWCDDTWPRHSRTIYYSFVSVVLYFFPILVMSLAYSLIIWRLWSTRSPGERIESEVRAQDKVKKKVVIMLVIIMLVFALCWLPFQISILYAEHRSNKTEPLPKWFSNVSFFANFMAFANSAFNPIIYTGFNKNFRKGFKQLFGYGTWRTKSYSAISGLSRDYSISQSTTVVTKI